MNDLIDTIERLAYERNLNMNQLCRICELNAKTFIKAKKNGPELSGKTMRKVSEGLGIKISEIYREAGL